MDWTKLILVHDASNFLPDLPFANLFDPNIWELFLSNRQKHTIKNLVKGSKKSGDSRFQGNLEILFVCLGETRILNTTIHVMNWLWTIERNSFVVTLSPKGRCHPRVTISFELRLKIGCCNPGVSATTGQLVSTFQCAFLLTLKYVQYHSLHLSNKSSAEYINYFN